MKTHTLRVQDREQPVEILPGLVAQRQMSASTNSATALEIYGILEKILMKFILGLFDL
jgi:hypothetical protein